MFSKYTHIRFSAIAISLLTLFAACDGFLDVNENPNAPISENLSLSAKFPAALVASVNQETGQLNQLGALWGGYWGTTSEGINMFFNQKTYNGQGMRDVRDGYPVWETSYTILLHYELIKAQAIEENAPFYEGAAKIMQGWHFMRLVDIYNNVPFDEALKGTAYATPTYEPGQQVYQKSMDLITDGIEAIKQASPADAAGGDDVLFGGDAGMWIKFANTIKLRGLIRQSEAGTAETVQQQLNIINAEGSGFLNVGENAFVQPGYLNTAGKLNPFWENYYRNVQGATTGNYQDIRPTSFILTQYEALMDPRLSKLYTAVDGAYKGVVFGDPMVNHARYGREVTSAFLGPEEQNGMPGALLKNATQPSVLMAAFESLFLQAEAIQRGWLGGDAAEIYQAAIQESLRYMEVPTSEWEAYLHNPQVAYSGSIEQIILQKWLALNSISSIEAWNDHRRLGLPAFPNSLQVPNNIRPWRLMYPETERMTNNDEASRQGSDLVTENKVWWNK